MKILYIANVRIPTPRTHGLQIVKMCEAFAINSAEVLLVVPRIKNITGKDVYQYYGVKQNFKIKYLPAINWLFLGFAGFILRELTFTVSVLAYGVNKRKNTDIIFSRSIFSLYVLSFFRKNVFFEIHDLPHRFSFVWKFLFSRMTGIISTNQWKAEQLRDKFGIPERKILVYPNGFDPELFKIQESKEELRKILNLPQDKPIAMYTGHLYDWKGADVMAEAAGALPDVNFVFVGGTEEDVALFRGKFKDLKNFFLLGHKPYIEMSKYLKSADVLVLPNSAKTEESRRATSPLKLFEYMASSRPIVASDLPSIREIVSDDEVCFVKPDSSQELSLALQKIIQDKKIAYNLATKSLEKSKKFSLDNRARAIAEFMELRQNRKHG